MLETGAVTIAADRSSATINGDYMGSDEVNIPGNINVNSVVFDRTFTKGVSSTITLPFSIEWSKVEGATFYAVIISENENGSYVADAYSCPGTQCPGESLEANRPYMVMPDGGNLTFNGAVVLNTSEKKELAAGTGWAFKGSYRHIVFGDSAETILGYAYGYAGVSQDGYSAGNFVKAGAKADIPAMRAYLVNDGWKTKPKNAPKPQNGASYAPIASVESLPSTIEVHFHDSEEDSGTTVVGTWNPVSGQIHLNNRSTDRWLGIQGGVLKGKPTVKGRYFHNGRIEVIK